MYVFGGYVNGGKSNDLWSYEINSGQWACLDEGDYHITDHKLIQKIAG